MPKASRAEPSAPPSDASVTSAVPRRAGQSASEASEGSGTNPSISPVVQPPDVALRAALEADHAFVVSSWLDHYLRNARVTAHLPRKAFLTRHRVSVMDALMRGTCIVAGPPDDDGTIIGYGVGERDGFGAIVHWIYVKHDFRRYGVGRLLFGALTAGAAEPVTVTCRTNSSEAIEREHPALALAYDPHRL